MNLLRYTLAVVLFVCVCTVGVSAQEASGEEMPDEQVADYALTAFTRLLDSQSEAQKLIESLRAYQARSPWKLMTVISLSHKALYAGWRAGEVLPLLEPCGDAVAALDGKDEELNAVVLSVSAIKKKREVYPQLVVLARGGLPVFQILGEAIKLPAARVQKLAHEDKLPSEDVYKFLLEGFTKRYGGTARKKFDALKK